MPPWHTDHLESDALNLLEPEHMNPLPNTTMSAPNSNVLLNLFHDSIPSFHNHDDTDDETIFVDCPTKIREVHCSWISKSVCSRYRTDKLSNEDRVCFEVSNTTGLPILFAAIIDGHAGDYTADFVGSLLGYTVIRKLVEYSQSSDHPDVLFSISNESSITRVIKDAFAEVDHHLCFSVKQILPVSFLYQNTFSHGKHRPAKRHNFEKHLQTQPVNCMQDTTVSRIISSGCVVCVVCVVGGLLITAGLGDCSILVKQGASWWEALTGHHPEQEEEKRRITTAGGIVRHNSISGLLSVSRSFGDIMYKESFYNMSKVSKLSHEEDIVVSIPDVRCYAIERNSHFCVLGSDGLFMALEKASIVRIIREGQKRGESGYDICEEVLKRAESVYDQFHSRRMEDDDISVGILFFNQWLFLLRLQYFIFDESPFAIQSTWRKQPFRSFSQESEKVIASKDTASIKREIPVINQLKRGSQKISIKNMVVLLVVTNVILVGLIIRKKKLQQKILDESEGASKSE